MIQPRTWELSSLPPCRKEEKGDNTKYRRHTDPNGRNDQNEMKRYEGLNYFKVALYFGLPYKPSSGAECKKICGKKTVTNKN